MKKKLVAEVKLLNCMIDRCYQSHRASARYAFSESSFGKFVEECQISYFVGDITGYYSLAPITDVEVIVCFTVDEETETLLRLRADGNVVFQ